MNELNQLRKDISSTDDKIAELFLYRMQIVEKIAKYKFENNLEIYDNSRENEILSEARHKFGNDDIDQLYTEFLSDVIEISKKYQRILFNKI